MSNTLSDDITFEEALKTLTTQKQKQFVKRYLVNGFNATEAAIYAGYSDNTAAVIGHENLRKPNIKAAIDAGMRDTCISAAEVVARLSGMGRATLAPFYNKSGELDLSSASAQAHFWLIKKYKAIPTESGVREEIEVHDPKDALKVLANHHGLLREKVDVDVTSGGEVIAYLPTNGRKKPKEDK